MLVVNGPVGAHFFSLLYMDTQAILEEVEKEIAPALNHMGYELIERELVLESGRFTLRLFIDKEGGVNVADCEHVSHGIGDLIEVKEIVPVAYNLEISSPGILRPLRRHQDFVKYSGSTIRLKTLAPIDGRSNYKGFLEGIVGDDIVMVIDETHFKIPFNMLAKARIEEEIKIPNSKKETN